MRSSYSALMQSKYFSPAFNSAIFDGPFRIYFAQFHESVALKVYLMIQQQLADEVLKAKEYCKNSGGNILIMMYPTQDHFVLSFEEEFVANGMACESWEQDFVIGINGPLADEKFDSFLSLLKQTIANLPEANSLANIEPSL